MHSYSLKVPKFDEVKVIANSDWSGPVKISWRSGRAINEVTLPDGLLPRLVLLVVSEKIRQQVEGLLDGSALERFLR